MTFGEEVFRILEQQENPKISCDLWIQNVTKRLPETKMCARKKRKNSESDAEADMNCKRPKSVEHAGASVKQIKDKKSLRSYRSTADASGATLDS